MLRLIILLQYMFVQGYVFHNHVSLNQPYEIQYNANSAKDFKKIDEQDAYHLSSFWYEQLKVSQDYHNEPMQNIQYLYSNIDDDYLKMSNMMSLKYNIKTDDSHCNEYMIWKPKLKPHLMKDVRENSIFYPCFRQTMCLICFKRITNSVYVENIIYTPFWQGDTNQINKKAKSIIVQHFLEYLKHYEIYFE
jgi:hypothetical protein